MDASSKELLRELLTKAELNKDNETVQKILQIAKTEGVVFSKQHYAIIHLKMDVRSGWKATQDEIETALHSCLQFSSELEKHGISLDITDREVRVIW